MTTLDRLALPVFVVTLVGCSSPGKPEREVPYLWPYVGPFSGWYYQNNERQCVVHSNFLGECRGGGLPRRFILCPLDCAFVGTDDHLDLRCECDERALFHGVHTCDSTGAHCSDCNDYGDCRPCYPEIVCNGVGP